MESKRALTDVRLGKLKIWLSLFFLLGILLASIGSIIYKNVIKTSSQELYTVAVIVDVYATSKDYGRIYSYDVKGVTYFGYCTTDDCSSLNIGDKYLVKFWSKRHDWSILLTDNPVGTLAPPQAGWLYKPEVK